MEIIAFQYHIDVTAPYRLPNATAYTQIHFLTVTTISELKHSSF